MPASFNLSSMDAPMLGRHVLWAALSSGGASLRERPGIGVAAPASWGKLPRAVFVGSSLAGAGAGWLPLRESH